MNFLEAFKAPPPLVNGSASYTQVRPVITTAIETITPDIARQYLGHANPLNRNISRTGAQKYGRDMQAGRWALTGEPIIFDEAGMLVDGHHRLTGAIEAGATFQSVVVRGVPVGAVVMIDGGRSRTAGDMAHMEGVQNSKVAAAIMANIILHEKHGIEFLNSPEKSPTKAEIVAAMRTCSDLQLCVMRAGLIRQWVPKSVGGFCYHFFQLQNRQKADRFFEDLHTGERLSAGNPALVLRNRLIDNQTKKARLPKLYLIALFFKAWAAYRDGAKVKLLRWRSEGDAAESFPQI